jgi:hypothetical protein
MIFGRVFEPVATMPVAPTMSQGVPVPDARRPPREQVATPPTQVAK